MTQITGLPELLGLAGLDIDVVEREADGTWTAHVTTAGGPNRCCPDCRQPSDRDKDFTTHSVKHLVVTPVLATWHKARFWCDNSDCETMVFVETGPIESDAAVSAHAKTVMGHLVGDWMVPVSRVAGAAGVAWHTAHDAFVDVATDAGIRITDTGAPGATTLDTGAPDSGTPDTGAPDSGGATNTAAGDDLPDSGDTSDIPSVRACRSVTGSLPPVTVLGIDDHRRGRPLYHRNPLTGSWVADADRWASVFVDSGGGHGLLGQVEGRAAADVTTWLTAQNPGWLAGITHVTIDMSTVYASAVRAALPNATLVVDLFHIVQLANKVVGDVRRRVTHEHYGRRGHTDDPEYAIRNLLVRNADTLSRTARHKILCTLADLGDHGRQLGAAWRAKELVRGLTRLSPNQTGHAATRDKVGKALETIYTFAATTGATIPEVVTLTETISTWRAEITRGVLTGHNNATAEGVNRLIKLVYRTAFGFTNVTNQQRRSRYAASRTTRPNWLHPVTDNPPQPVAT